jgi:hypothetical protein
VAQQLADGHQVDSWFQHARDMSDYPITLAGDGIEELQGTYGLVELAPRGMQLVDHPKLEVSNLLEPQFFRVFSKPHGKSIDVVRVGVDGPG